MTGRGFFEQDNDKQMVVGNMKEQLVIGLDIGTTSAKAVLFRTDGSVVKEVEEELETMYLSGKRAEQDPAEVDRKTRKALAALMEGVEQTRIISGGFSAAMHSLIFVDGDGEAISNASIWSDAGSLESMGSIPMKEEIYARTGTPIHPMTPLVKLHHHKKRRTDMFRRAEGVVSLKEYIIHNWFGDDFIDYSMASATGMYNLKEGKWDEKALEVAGISERMLNRVSSPRTRLSPFKAGVAEEIGISETIPFYLGACDGQLANLGDGAIRPGEAAISAGTSGAIRQFAHSPYVDDSRETFTYAFEKDSFIIGGPTNNGGIVLQWLKNVMNFDGSPDEFTELAEEIAPGAEGVLFIPHVNGERAPVWDPEATGSFHHLGMRHGQAHFVRACLEGIAFNLYHIGHSVERISGRPEKIRMNGGLAKSRVFVKILADVFGQDIELSITHHSAAWGAAWVSLFGSGKVGSYEEIREYTPVGEIIRFNEENHRTYQEVFKKYRQLTGE
ncbi:gluconokinase [Salimicrobium salexigens]|uniref:Gluconate kinase, FGGY family n=1 Tax=Salimicrobium salexigens TaxID=908941 RepID=A0ABY1KL75_9BACI|nr:gluconokinase [Salimicrobium salexigens]SIS47126.1 gluconate kinase, FGGY family [Salimicrobium salexigens]